MMRNWFIAFGMCIVAVLLTIHYVDMPIAEFAHNMPWKRALHTPALGIPILIGLSIVVVAGLAAQVARGGPMRLWEEAALLIALSLSWGVSVTETLLKPLFGRPMPEVFFSTGAKGFHWWHRALDNSFPSGHAVQIASVITVLWILYPRLRVVWALIAAIVFLMLIFGNWHFVSDVIAGAFLGCFGASVITGLWQSRQRLD
jgi:membrane-associated phospholipid phosphatase